MAILEGGNNTANLVNVDGNNDLMVTTPQVNTRYGGVTGVPNYVGASRIFFENEAGTLSGTSMLISPMVTYDDNLQFGLMTPLFEYSFNGAAQDTGLWYFATTTMTASQGGGFLLFNASNIGTTTTGEYMQTKRVFNLTGNAGLRVGMIANITLAIAANQVIYFGLGIPASATTAPTDGIWFQYSSAGLIGVLAYNGTLTQTGALPTANPVTIPINTNVQLQIRIHDRICYFMYDGNIIGSIATPAGQGTPFMYDALPLFVQQINTGTVSGSTWMQLKVATTFVDQLDSQLTKPYPHIQAAKGLCAYQATQGGTMGSTSNLTNSMATGAGNALANATVNAAYVGLGGQITYQPTLTASTDGILCSYQNPAGSVNQTPRTLYITGVRIQSVVSAAFTGGPVYAVYSLAFGHYSSVSLATGEQTSFTSGTTKMPRRIPLGFEIFPITSAIGQVSTTNCPVQMTFLSPIVVNPGEYVQIAAKNVGTVTSGGTITSMVVFDGYVE